MSLPKQDFGFEDEANEKSGIVSGHIFRSVWEHRPLGFRFVTERHGGISQFITYDELAALLTREDIDQLDAAMRRQQRHSGVESLDDVGDAWGLDDYVALESDEGGETTERSPVEQFMDDARNSFVRKIDQIEEASRGGVKVVPDDSRTVGSVTTSHLLNSGWYVRSHSSTRQDRNMFFFGKLDKAMSQ